ncbi:MAG: hypothetical protein OEZ43_19930 [Gammaproteobacteria bacterium]|nr:hypothetical protein [Gammaproteobacteria bacterium]
MSGRGRPKVLRYAEEKLNGVGPEHQLHSLVSKNKLRNESVSTCLDIDEYQLLSIEAPAVPEDELLDALKWQVAEFVETPVDDLALEFYDVPSVSNIGKGRQVNVVVVKKSIIEAKAQQIKSAGLNLTTIDVPELAIRNLMNSVGLDKNGVVFLYISGEKSLLVFVRKSIMYFCRTLNIGSRHLAQQPQLTKELAQEVQRSLEYFERHFNAVGIERMVVAPMSGKMPDVAGYLDKKLSIPCAYFDYQANFKWRRRLPKSKSSISVLSLGAALRTGD